MLWLIGQIRDWRLDKLDKNDVNIKLWAKRKVFEYVPCKLCMYELKYSKLTFLALVQHLEKNDTKVFQRTDFETMPNIQIFNPYR